MDSVCRENVDSINTITYVFGLNHQPTLFSTIESPDHVDRDTRSRDRERRRERAGSKCPMIEMGNFQLALILWRMIS